MTTGSLAASRLAEERKNWRKVRSGEQQAGKACSTTMGRALRFVAPKCKLQQPLPPSSLFRSSRTTPLAS